MIHMIIKIKFIKAYGAYMDLQNQMRIMQSNDFIGEIIDKISKFILE